MAPDALKAFAIFGVVYIHCGPILGDTAAVQFLSETFRFGVPVFVTIWAYFHERSYLGGSSWRSVVPARLSALAVPFLAWSTLYFLIVADFPKLTPVSVVTRYWLGHGWSGQYFFIILFQLVVAFPLIRRFPIGTRSLLAIFGLYAALFALEHVLALPGWVAKLGDRPLPYWLPYAALGVYLARNPHRGLPWQAAPAGLLLIATEAAISWQPLDFDASYVTPGVLIGSGLLAASVLNRDFSGRGAFCLLRPGLLLIGSSTMGIFVLNPLVLVIGRTLARQEHWQGSGSPAGSLLVSLASAGVALALCLAATLALKRLGCGRLVS